MPGEFKCDDMLNLVLTKAVKPENLISLIYKYISDRLGPTYIQNNSVTIQDVFEDSNKSTPIVFIVSEGVDPVESLMKYASTLGC